MSALPCVTLRGIVTMRALGLGFGILILQKHFKTQRTHEVNVGSGGFVPAHGKSPPNSARIKTQSWLPLRSVGFVSQLKSERGWKWCFFKGCIFMPRFSIQTDKWLFPFMESWDLPAEMSLNSGLRQWSWQHHIPQLPLPPHPSLGSVFSTG